MENKYLLLEIPPSDLASVTTPKAIDAIKAIEISPYCTLLEICANDHQVALIVEIEIELPQYAVKQIERYERIAIVFTKDDSTIPEVFSLRADFPSDVPHLNLRDFEYPKNLCIYDQVYSELKIRWNTVRFIEDIRQWMSFTALNKLHQDTQQLEPLLRNDNGVIMFPAGAWTHEELFVSKLAETKDGKEILRAFSFAISGWQETSYTTLLFDGNPLLHGVIYRTPKCIGDLQIFMSRAGINLITDVIKKLQTIIQTSGSSMDNRLLFLVDLPKKRTETSKTFEHEYFSFATLETIKTIADKVGLIARMGNVTAPLIGATVNVDSLNAIEVVLFSAIPLLTEAMARVMNGVTDYPEDGDIHICGIGVGALGSSIFMNCAKSGYGRWLLIDNDRLMPHNCARHILDTFSLGQNKAYALSEKANFLFDNQFATFLEHDILQVSSESESIVAINASDLILDMSASVSVGRFLANNELITKRLISIFLNPTGSDLVMLSENSIKTITVDEVEMVYYRHLITQDELAQHLFIKPSRQRYSTSCRDVTSVISQDNISILSGIASKEVKNLDDAAWVKIWCIKYEGNVESYNYPVAGFNKKKFGEWTILYDSFVIDKLNDYRKMKLPNETGGVLLGCYDTFNKKIYIVDVIGSPTDSFEYPTAYIRGINGIETILSKVDERTAGMVQYIGEWHSHPQYCSLKPSEDDKNLFKWLSENMRKDGNPTLMLIKGDKDAANILFQQF